MSNLFNRFVSEEQSVNVSGRIGQQVEGDPQIKSASLDRELNSLVPILHFKSGTEDNLLTFEDIVNRARALGLDVERMKEWMSEKAFNFVPPINFDKFINYTNYYWVTDAFVNMPWNPDGVPEYYVISRPSEFSTAKLDVHVATKNSIKLTHANRDIETITIEFISATSFAVTGSEGIIIPDLVTLSSTAPGEKTTVALSAPASSGIATVNNGDSTGPLCEFTLTNGQTPFVLGDKFLITIEYGTSNIAASFVSPFPSGKGGISGIVSKTVMQWIDGVKISIGTRILVKDQGNYQNGIYVVKSNGKIERAFDAKSSAHLPLNTQVFVRGGTDQAKSEWTVTTRVNDPSSIDNVDVYCGFVQTGTNTISKINSWQSNNRWYHIDEIDEKGLSRSGLQQATRPIIEYVENIKLTNSFDSEDLVPQGDVFFRQSRRQINQIPLFDLYRYDGTPANICSSIFYYVEDPDYPIDSDLFKRVKTTENADFVFGVGITDEQGRQLYFKVNDELHTTWAPCSDAPTVYSLKKNTESDLTINVSHVALADIQDWTITFTSPSVFSVTGTRSGSVGNGTIGTPFTCPEGTFSISAGSIAPVAGDSITWSVYNRLSPRRVTKAADGSIVNDYSDASIQTDDNTWLVPLRMFQNLDRNTEYEIAFGDLLNHMRSVVKEQDGFEGSSFGKNNTFSLDFDPSRGGTIRDFSGNFPLFCSMMFQDQISPITIIDFAEQQYVSALSSIDQFMINHFADYLSTVSATTGATIDPFSDEIAELFANYEALRASDQVLTEVFKDTTAGIANWPITLPQMGLMPKTEPGIRFDPEIGMDMLVHHDGHVSPIAGMDADFNRELVKSIVARSDGTSSAGIFSETMPSMPYARQLWLKPSTFELKVFDVDFDNNSTPIGKQDGQIWYNRATNQLFVWSAVSSSWIAAAFTVASRWKEVTTQNIRNSLILRAEYKLYDAIHPAQQLVIDLTDADDSEFAELELAKYSLKYGIDTYAPNYVATDAFTWNYSNASVAGLASVPARWYDIYKQYIAIHGGVPTCRQNLEPWKLLGINAKPATWDAQYACDIQKDESKRIAAVKTIAVVDVPLLFGLQTISGVSLANGDRVVLANQNMPIFNGVYVVSSAGWSRSADVLQNGTTVKVSDGMYADTEWVITTANPITINTTNILFEQSRMWSTQMWLDIKAGKPAGFKLGVNIFTDELLPPYSTNSEAIVSSIPTGISNEYVFGDNGPGELVWTKSLEYSYGLVRSYFKLNPTHFLDKTWGYTYVNHASGQFRLERNLVNTLPPSKLAMHGEKLHIQNTLTGDDILQRMSGAMTWTGAGEFKAVVACVGDNQTVFNIYIDNQLLGYINEGTPLTVSHNNISLVDLKIDDIGIPYSLGESLIVKFFDNVIDPDFVPPTPPSLELGCEGCVHPDEPNVEIVFPTIPVPPVYQHISAIAQKLIGIGQLYTNLLRYSYIDTDVSRATLAYRGWTTKLGHRFGALIRDDSLKIKTSQGNLPTTAYSVLLKKSANTKSMWMTALRIQLVEMGARELNEFGIFVPKGDGSDWKFRIESYNPQNPALEYYQLDKNGSFTTFNALQNQNTDLEWRRLSNKLQLSKLLTPLIVTGIQNIVDIVYGYVDRLEELGFTNASIDKSSIDAETGRNLDWQLEVEKFIDRVYSGVSAGEGHILNPYMESFCVKTPVGLLGKYSSTNFIDVYSAQSAVDVTGTIIPIDQLTVIRTDDDTVTRSSTPIFAAHVFIDEYEHVLLINNRFSDEMNANIAFSPFLGLRINSAYLDYTRHEVQHGKPTFDGFFLSGNKAVRNIVSSVENISNFYDPVKTFNEPTTAKHALALLGYQSKSYFDNLTSSDATQFNFWRGLIQAKGTNLTIDAFVNYKKFASAGVDEYWAYKIAEYGDAREKTFPEIRINTQDCSQKFTRLQFFSNSDTGYDALPQYIQIESNDDTRWFSIDDLSKGLRFEAQFITEKIEVPASATFPVYIRLANIFHNGDNAAPVVSDPAVTLIGASLVKVTAPGEYTVSGYTWINASKLSPIKLFDFQEQTLISEIGLWHPAIGLHAANALEVVDIIQNSDPANYNYTTKTTNNPNFKHLKPWGENEVGRVWWDTSNLAYVPYYDAAVFPSRDARHARWGALAEWASVDLYEWVESNTHPIEYDERAKQEEGRADIPKLQRASGKSALKKYYKRNRIISGRPIAWSRNGGRLPVDQDPSLGPAEFVKILVGISSTTNADGVLFADVGRTSALGLDTGVHFGAWKNSKPYGEVLITGDLEYAIGTQDQLIANATPLVSAVHGLTIMLQTISSNPFGYEVGSIKLQKIEDGVNVILRASSQADVFSDVLLEDWAVTSPGEVSKNIQFDRIGLSLTIMRDSLGTITASQLANEIINTVTDIYVREGVRFSNIFDLPDSIFINDEADPLFPTVEYGYRTWLEPSQSELSSDLLSPHNKWYPILGDKQQLTASPELTAKMVATSNVKTLKSGIKIERYTSAWTDWEELSSIKMEKIADGTNTVTFILPVEIDTNRLSLYANGVQINPAAITVNFNAVTLSSYPEGTTLFLLYRAYVPSDSEMTFDPDVEDNFEIQTQFKADYQYTKIDVRDASGNVAQTKYYFWVENKTIPSDNKTMSLQQAQIELEQGPSTFALFSRLVPDSTEVNKASYDSCAVAGLNNLVTKNNSYKLRFLRDFTLRDDPEQLNLKNTHAEWALMRKGQSGRIPEQLWSVLTNAAAGQDEFGQQVPSQVRVDYDLRNGTRTRYGFKGDQIFADRELVVASIINTILNTTLTINLGSKKIVDYITALDLNKSEEWFATPDAARATMALIWNSARPKQINEIFFSVLDDALASNYEFTDIFKTSFITVSSTTNINQAQYGELADDIH